MRTRWNLLSMAVLAIGTTLAPTTMNTSTMGGLFKLDFGELENIDDEVEDWDIFETFVFDDFDGDSATWDLTDWAGAGDEDVTLTIMDNEDLADEFGSFAIGMTSNNPTHELEDVEYDGVPVPFQVKDDYLYRNLDTAGTELLFRFDNLDPGNYNVTLFLGRTTDANGQFGKVWVDSDASGAGEPDDENTGDFSATLPEVDIEGHPQTVPVEVKAGEHLWFAYMEDNSGGISGMIVRNTSPVGMVGDFNSNGSLDVEDINLLNAEIIAGSNPAAMDLNSDGIVNQLDLSAWVVDLKKTWFGDANLDGEFNSADFVLVFQTGKFELDQAANWQEGDWNADGRFNSSDFVSAFQDGGFELGPRAAAQPVPEPSGVGLLLVGVLTLPCFPALRSLRRSK